MQSMFKILMLAAMILAADAVNPICTSEDVSFCRLSAGWQIVVLIAIIIAFLMSTTCGVFCLFVACGDD